MRSLMIAFCIMISAITITSCSNNDEGNPQSGEALAQEINNITNALQNQSFRFDGSTTLRGDNFTQQNIVNFSGFVDNNKDTYMRLLTAQEENGIVEDMDIYSKGKKLYMRFADQVDWEPIGDRTELLETEISHLSPLAHLQRMQTMIDRIEQVSNRTNLASIRVYLNENALQEELVNNIKARIESYDKSGRNELFKSLSSGIAGEQGIMDELESLHNVLKQDVEDIGRTTRVSGYYHIQYEKKTKLPTNITYVQTIDYSQDGRNEREISEIDISLTQFGETTLPSDLPKNLK